jgi:beta-aspartyl-peptidase (threonine type)
MRTFVLSSLLLSGFLTGPSAHSLAQSDTKTSSVRYGLVIHGGAGVIERASMSAELEAEYRTKLTAALDAGYAILDTGGTAVDAVVATIRVMEDSPLFNSGYGAVLNADGNCELDASIMDGADKNAGAIASVTTVRNPIALARDVMLHSKHVMLAGKGAEIFAASLGYEPVPNSYFITERRKAALERAKSAEAAAEDASKAEQGEQERIAARHRTADTPRDGRDRIDDAKFGTVGCAALDQHGNLAAGTSTGGLTNKKFGRIGDSPIVGAGVYADNATCALSATGQGEYFIRAVVGHDVAAQMAYGNRSLADAAAATIKRVGELGGTGGVIAMDARGNIAMPFNTAGMYRGYRQVGGVTTILIFGDE